MLDHLKPYLKGKVVILGVGNTLRSDDGVGSLLAKRIKEKVPFIVWDTGVSPENYLGKAVNLFSTHNASISLTINYLQSHLKADIIILLIQPKSIAFGDCLSSEVGLTLAKLESWFYEAGKEKG
jgi:hydrogenase 3 maturation protease